MSQTQRLKMAFTLMDCFLMELDGTKEGKCSYEGNFE